MFAVIGVAIILGTIQSSENTKQPEAIDVYRGKTELIVIHYDTNNIDSVVIWKSE